MNTINFDKVIDAVKRTKAIVLDKELKQHISMKGDADFVTEVDFRISSFLPFFVPVIVWMIMASPAWKGLTEPSSA